MVHPGGPRRLGGFPLPPPPAPLKQHCKMQKLSPPRATSTGPVGGYIWRPPRRLRGRGDPGACRRGPRRPRLWRTPRRPCRPPPGRRAARGAVRTSAHTPKGGRPPPPTRHQRGERRERGRQREGRAPPPASPHLSNVENPNTSFKHLGNIQPRAQRACAPPPPSSSSRRRPRPHRIHAPHRPGPGGGGAAKAGPREGVACHCRWGARVAEGTGAGPRGAGTAGDAKLYYEFGTRWRTYWAEPHAGQARRGGGPLL